MVFWHLFRNKVDNSSGTDIVRNNTELPFSFYKFQLNRTTFWTRKSDLYVEPEINEPQEDKENGFTNIAATGDNNMQIFSVEEKRVFRDPNLDTPVEDKGTEIAVTYNVSYF